jgi:hypothetical protein
MNSNPAVPRRIWAVPLAVVLWFAAGCSTTAAAGYVPPAPVYPKGLTWVNYGDHTGLSYADAVRLYNYLVDAEAYIRATQGGRDGA